MAKQQHYVSSPNPMLHPTTDRTRENSTNATSSNPAKNNRSVANALPQSSALAIAVDGSPVNYNFDPEKGETLFEIPLSPTTKPPPSVIIIPLATDAERPSRPSSLVGKPAQSSKISSSSLSTVQRWIIGTLCYLTVFLFLASVSMILVRFLAHQDYPQLYPDDEDESDSLLPFLELQTP